MNYWGMPFNVEGPTKQRQRHGVGQVQSWSGELEAHGDQQTGEDGNKQVFAPDRMDILKQDPADLVQPRAVLCIECNGKPVKDISHAGLVLT